MQKSQIISLYNSLEVLLKHLSHFKGGSFLLKMQIIEQKINFHSFLANKKIGKKKQPRLMRSIYKEDYFCIEECQSDQNQVLHTFNFYIRHIYILFKILVVVGEREASFRLQQRFINVLSKGKDKENLKRVIQKLYNFLSPNCQSVQKQPQLCRLILKYDRIIQEKGEEIFYFQKQKLLIDLLKIHHIQRPDRCFYIIKKMFKLLNIYNTSKNIRSLTQSIKILIRWYFDNPKTKMFFKKYITTINLQNTPYEFSILYRCYMDLSLGSTQEIFLKFMKIFTNVKLSYAAEYIGSFSLIHMIKPLTPLPQRKVRRLNYIIVRYRFFSISLSNVIALLIDPVSLKYFKKSRKQTLLNCYTTKLQKFLQYLFQIPFQEGISANFQWNRIYPKNNEK